MAKLYIPQVGDQLKLISNWDCKVFNEHRNSKVFSGLNVDVTNHPNTNIEITFPKGTLLRVDRLYVRAPASSYDSITFSVVGSPIKALIKARFWVKLMDANKIEFEEIINSIDSYKKLKDCFRFVALKNDFQNSERLNENDSNFVCKEIFNHYKIKNNNEIIIKFPITIEEAFNTIELQGRVFYSEREQYAKNRTIAFDKIKNLFQATELTLHLLPVLDGWVYYYDINEYSIKIDKTLDIYQKIIKHYNTELKLGSFLSREVFAHSLEKNELPSILSNHLQYLNTFKIEYQGNTLNIQNQKEFDKFIKNSRVKILKD